MSFNQARARSGLARIGCNSNRETNRAGCVMGTPPALSLRRSDDLTLRFIRGLGVSRFFAVAVAALQRRLVLWLVAGRARRSLVVAFLAALQRGPVGPAIAV